MSAESEQRQHELDEAWDIDPGAGTAIAVVCVFVALAATLVVLMIRAFNAAA